MEDDWGKFAKQGIYGRIAIRPNDQFQFIPYIATDSGEKT